MKLLIGSSAAPDRGAGISAYSKEIAEEFIKKGYTVYYASPAPDNDQWLLENNIILIETPFKKDMGKLVSDLLATINNEGIEAIINNDNAVVQNIAPFFSKVFLSVGHCNFSTIASMLGHNIEWVDYTVAISSDMQIDLMKRFNIPPFQCPIIYNGIKNLNPGFQTRSENNESIRVVFGGGLIPNKGGDILKSLLFTIKNSNINNIYFDIFGETPKGIPTELQNVEYFKFHGKVPRNTYLTAIAKSDIFLLPSRSEGCPMSLLEAMSFGLAPVVSNGKGAMRWIITNAENGYVCDLNKWASQCLETLLHLRDNRKELARVQKNAQQICEQAFKVQDTVNKLEILLNKPVVSRATLPTSAKIINWHRWPNSSIIQRINYRLGRLVFHSIFYRNCRSLIE